MNKKKIYYSLNETSNLYALYIYEINFAYDTCQTRILLIKKVRHNSPTLIGIRFTVYVNEFYDVQFFFFFVGLKTRGTFWAN